MTRRERYEVRKGRVRDAESAVPLWQEIMDYHRAISPLDFETTAEAPTIWRRFFVRNVLSRNRTALVAEAGGGLVGYLLGSLAKRPPVFTTTYCGHLQELAVTAEWRRRGVGTGLVDAFAAWARAREVDYVMLDVVVENVLGRAFWEQQGFATTTLRQRRVLRV